MKENIIAYTRAKKIKKIQDDLIQYEDLYVSMEDLYEIYKTLFWKNINKEVIFDYKLFLNELHCKFVFYGDIKCPPKKFMQEKE